MLRAATRAAHDRVDALFGDYDLGRRDDYCRFLTAQAAAFLPAEAAIDRAGGDELFPGWAETRRAGLLRADLEGLGLETPTAIPAPDLHSAAAVAGAAYVLEGSRLGGAMLARSVAAGAPRQFLTAPQRPGQWRDFLARLDKLLPSDADRREAVDSAARTFEVFARAARLSTDVA